MAKTNATNTNEDQEQQLVRLAQLEQELAASQEAHKRALADFANLKQRTVAQQQQQREQACRDLMLALLPTLDSLNLAMVHQTDPGLNLIVAEFQRVLSRYGLQPIAARGQVFDPHTMEAVGTAPGPQDQVISEEQLGYQLNGIILRPTRVIVGAGSNSEKKQEEKE